MDSDIMRGEFSFEMRGEFIPGQVIGQMIQFQLDLEVETSNWILNQDSPIPQIDGQDPPSIHTSLAINTVPNSITHGDIRKAVQYAIDNCDYCLYVYEERHQLMDRAWAEVCKIFEGDGARRYSYVALTTLTPPYSYGVLLLHCMARLQLHRVVQTHTPRMLTQPVELHHVYDVDCPRAAVSSLGLLATGCCCCICWEGGDGALRMPRSHFVVAPRNRFIQFSFFDFHRNHNVIM